MLQLFNTKMDDGRILFLAEVKRLDLGRRIFNLAAMRIVFSHIPKTAGTSLHRVFMNLLAGSDRTFKYFMRSDGIPPERFGTRTLPENWAFIGGHIQLRYLMDNEALDLNDPETVLLSFVRDPVDRILSLYNFIRVTPRHRLHNEVRSMSAVDFLMSEPANVHMDFLTPKGARPECRVLLAAVDHLAETGAELASELMGQDIGIESFQKRHNEGRREEGVTPLTRADLSDAVLQKLKQRHAEDAALYQKLYEGGPMRSLP